MVILLVLGERTLPILGGDRALAARLYKSLFMLLTTGVITGLIPAGSRYLACFLRAQIEATPRHHDIFAAWGRFLTRYDIPSLMEGAASVLTIFIGIAGIILTLVIWQTE